MGKSLPWYVCGQAIAYSIDFGIFFLLVPVLGLGFPVVANLFAKICAATFAFFFHEHFSFPGEKANSLANSFLFYVLVVSSNMALTSLLLSFFLSKFVIAAVAAKFAADVIGVLFTFICLRTVVFARASSW